MHRHRQITPLRALYLHFWSVGDSVALATTMREAISATHVTPGS